MIANANLPHIALGVFISLLILHWVWCLFVAYPMSFERNLKRGKSWVYIPLRWKGVYKVQIAFLTRTLILVVAAAGIISMHLYAKRPWTNLNLIYGAVFAAAVWRLTSFLLGVRYRQQEDSYYFLHDELRTRLEGEGKDMAESAFKSLAAYQHQNQLRKADEKGQLIHTLRSQAKESRRLRKDFKPRQAVET